MTEELKPLPCPFCGGKGNLAEYDHHLKHHIYCDFCGAETPSGYSTPEKAITVWNRRVKPEELPEWLIDELINGLVLAKDDKTEGWNDALEWVLSLKKEDS
jgi:Lar family restriction alleviation protein